MNHVRIFTRTKRPNNPLAVYAIGNKVVLSCTGGHRIQNCPVLYHPCSHVSARASIALTFAKNSVSFMEDKLTDPTVMLGYKTNRVYVCDCGVLDGVGLVSGVFDESELLEGVGLASGIFDESELLEGVGLTSGVMEESELLEGVGVI
jgi:hypothetical protein